MAMINSRKRFEQVVLCFEVSDPTLHEKGHTIYKVTQRIIRVDATEEDIKEHIVWRRYNDFKKLHQAMLKLHTALHRVEEFPPFARAKMFGRYEDAVVIERMRSAQDLLNFVGQRYYMVASQTFKDFFQGSETVVRSPESGILKPNPVMVKESTQDGTAAESVSDGSQACTEVTSTDDQHESCSNHVQDDTGDTIEDGLGGVWKFPQVPDEISLDDDPDDSDEQRLQDLSSESPIDTAVAPSDDIFDPLHPQTQDQTDTTADNHSNEWLLSSLTLPDSTEGDKPLHQNDKEELQRLSEFFACDIHTGENGKNLQPELISIPNETSSSLPTSSEPSVHRSAFPGSSVLHPGLSPNDMLDSETLRTRHGSGSVIASGKGDLTVSPIGSSNLQSQPSSPLHSGSSASSSRTSLSSTASSPRRSPRRQGQYGTVEVRGKNDYIVQAGNKISLALQCETNAKYDMALDYYKSGVSILLTGVQMEDSESRRDFVRRKTLRYLLKAEELQKRKGSESSTWDTGQTSPGRELGEAGALLQGPVSELKNYKVLGVIGKVILVMDTVTENTYVIKVLYKSCSAPTSKPRRMILPTQVAYVVKLFKFYETDSGLYLLLQHASGGQLWSYVSGFLHQHQRDNVLDDVFDNDHEKKLRAGVLNQPADPKKPTVVGSDLKSPQLTDSEKCLFEKVNHSIEKPNDRFLAGNVDAQFTTAFKSSNVDISANEINLGDTGKVCIDAEDVTNRIKMDKPSSVTEQENYTPTFNREQKKLNISSSRKLSFNDTTPSPNTTFDFEGSSQTESAKRFEDILKETKPGIDNFSINSYESDSGPGSRYESTTSDHIESIPELNENTPHTSPQKARNSPGEEVFLDPPLGQHICSDYEKPSDIDNLVKITDCDNFKQHLETDARGTRHSTGAVTQDIFPAEQKWEPDVKSYPAVTSTPLPDKSATVPDRVQFHIAGDESGKEEEEETSIYDQYRNNESDNSRSDVSRSPSLDKMLIPEQPPVGSRPNVPGTVRTTQSLNENTVTSPDKTKSLKISRSEVFVVPSRERDFDITSPTSPKPRLLSSVFADLDLADEKARSATRLPESCVRQWAAELVVAITGLHQLGIICRDLRPANILLGDKGHVTLTYFSQWPCVDQHIHQEALDQCYAAPEASTVFPLEPTCDWWSLGILLYELLTGQTFVSCHPSGVTSHSQVLIPTFLSSEAQSLLYQLLRYSPQERLGGGVGGVEDIKLHPFFAGIDWSKLQG